MTIREWHGSTSLKCRIAGDLTGICATLIAIKLLIRTCQKFMHYDIWLNRNGKYY